VNPRTSVFARQTNPHAGIAAVEFSHTRGIQARGRTFRGTGSTAVNFAVAGTNDNPTVG
jgi:hypothetical protein